MSLASKKRRRITRAAARTHGAVVTSVTNTKSVVIVRAPTARAKYIPSWLNACIKDGVAPRWSPRLKRHGGMMMIEATRELQFERIASAVKSMLPEKVKLLDTWHAWLLENKRRLLSSDLEDYFGLFASDGEEKEIRT